MDENTVLFAFKVDTLIVDAVIVLPRREEKTVELTFKVETLMVDAVTVDPIMVENVM
jgi:hypothetical protein